MFNRTALIASAALVVGVLGTSILFLTFRDRVQPVPIIINTPIPTATSAPEATLAPIQVFVNGAVAAPDVYTLAPGSRVKQAIEMAGGFTRDANTAVVNLAQPLVDGAHIYVPQMAESTAVPERPFSEPGQESRGGVIQLPGGKVININTAGLEELDELPGVGPTIAQKIIDYRTANGSFATIEAILEVSGIGEAKFQQIRDLITTGS